MPKSTALGGKLNSIENCYILIPDKDGKDYTITFDNLPDISDSKTANYNDETVIGRASPHKTYSQSDTRAISLTVHFITSDENSYEENIKKLRAIQSATYPRDGELGAPFVPPPVCRIKCGKLFSESGELCVLLKSYSVKFPTDVVWDSESYIPSRFDVDTTWDVVYTSEFLPGQQTIFDLGK